MKSLLREMEEKFHEINDSCDCGSPECATCNPDDIDEQNVSGAGAGFNTPNAFTSDKSFKKKKFKYESVNKPSTYQFGVEQSPECDEEIFNDKFPFATNDDHWWQSDAKYPVEYYADGMGTNNIKDTTIQKGNLPTPNKTTQISKHTLKVEDVLEKKYSELIESYRSFTKNNPDITPAKKVNDTIREIAKKLQEIETLVTYNSKLKTESGVTSSHYGASTNKALTKISERLIKISERVRSLGE
jgi:hypothetical protein